MCSQAISEEWECAVCTAKEPPFKLVEIGAVLNVWIYFLIALLARLLVLSLWSIALAALQSHSSCYSSCWWALISLQWNRMTVLGARLWAVEVYVRHFVGPLLPDQELPLNQSHTNPSILCLWFFSLHKLCCVEDWEEHVVFHVCIAGSTVFSSALVPVLRL